MLVVISPALEYSVVAVKRISLPLSASGTGISSVSEHDDIDMPDTVMTDSIMLKKVLEFLIIKFY